MVENQSDHHSALKQLRQVFEAFSREDPMYAALSRSGCDQNRWDPDAFFGRGVVEIQAVMAYVDSLEPAPQRKRALDFGCGVGRLTQALAEHFDEVVGIDIAATMVESARTYNRHGNRVQYVVNDAPDLSLLPSGSFDFVYTNKVLQHIPPEYQAGYVKEFIRLLRPGGLAVFQMRNGPRIRRSGPRSWLYNLNRRHLRRLAQRIRGRHGYEMHFLARSCVEEMVAEAGGRMLDVVDLSRGKPGKSLRYCATTQRRSSVDT